MNVEELEQCLSLLVKTYIWAYNITTNNDTNVSLTKHTISNKYTVFINGNTLAKGDTAEDAINFAFLKILEPAKMQLENAVKKRLDGISFTKSILMNSTNQEVKDYAQKVLNLS